MSGEFQLEEKIKKITIAVYKVTDLISEQEYLRFKIRELSDKIFEYSIRIFSNFLSIEERRSFFYNANQEFLILKHFIDIISYNYKFLKSENFDILITEYQLFFNKLKNLIVNYEQQQSFFASMIDTDENIKEKEDVKEVNSQNPAISTVFSNGDNNHKYIDFFDEFNSAKEIVKLPKIEPENKNLTVNKLKNNYLSYKLKERHQKIMAYLKTQPNGCHRQDLIKGLGFEKDPRTLSRDLEYLNSQGIIQRKGDRKGAIYFLKQQSELLEIKSLPKVIN